jgi:NAD(P)-dependent dehydrogenase (short-subunit alcohol dehydrogenase family)
MDLGLEGKVVLVTGGSGDIGSAVARAFGSERTRVAIAYHQGRATGELVAAEVVKLGGEAMITAYDLADDDSVGTAVANVINQWGRIDILVHAALRPEPAAWGFAFEDQSIDDWDASLHANLWGTMVTVRAVVPSMRSHGWGRIVLVAANALSEGVPGREAYAAGKSGLHGLARSLVLSLGPAGILVNGVVLSLSLTEKTRQRVPPPIVEQYRASTPTGQLSEPAGVADAIVFLASAANRNIAGAFVPVTGGR